MYMYCTVYMPSDGWMDLLRLAARRDRPIHTGIERKIMLTTIENRQQQQRRQDCIQGNEGHQEEEQEEIDPQLWLPALMEAAPNASHRRYSSLANIISATSSMGSPSTPSSSSSAAASEIEAQSTRSFFLDKSMTLGSLIGIELRPRLVNVEEEEEKKKKKKMQESHASTFACDSPMQVERTEKVPNIQQSCPIILLGCGGGGLGGWKFLWKLASRNHVTGTTSSFDCIYLEDKKETTNFEERWECDTKRACNLKTLMMINESNTTSTTREGDEEVEEDIRREHDYNLIPSPLGSCSSPQRVGWNVFNGHPLLLPWDR